MGKLPAGAIYPQSAQECQDDFLLTLDAPSAQRALEVADRAASPEEQFAAQERLDGVLARHSAAQREMFQSCREGCTYEEIAGKLRRSADHVRRVIREICGEFLSARKDPTTASVGSLQRDPRTGSASPPQEILEKFLESAPI